MPQIRAEQIQNEVIMDVQIAVNAAIQQSKIENWTSDPTGWLSEGIIKVLEVEPTWDGTQEGQLYYINTTDELHLGIGSDPWHIVIGGPNQQGWDAELTVRAGSAADDWTGSVGTQYSTTSEEFTLDGSNLYVYLNGVLQSLGVASDYTLFDSTTIQFTGNIIDTDAVTLIVILSPLVVGYASKAWVINRYEEDVVTTGAERVRVKPSGSITSITVQAALEEIQTDVDNIVAGTYDINFSMDDTYNDGSTVTVDDSNVIWNLTDTKFFSIATDAGSKQLFDVSASAGGDSLILGANTTLTGDFIPSVTNTYDLGSAAAKFAEIHAQTAYFDAATIHLGASAEIKYEGGRLRFTNDGGSIFLNAVGSWPGEDIVLEGRVLPDIQNTRDFGSASYAWKDVYVGTSINFVPVGEGGDVARIYKNISGLNTEMKFQIGSSANDKIIFEDEGNVALLTIGGDGDIEINGNLTVTGTTTSVESTNTQVNDSTFTISHSDVAADGDAAFIVERATTNSKLFWNDSIDQWQVDNGDGGGTRDILFNGYDNYLYTNKVTNSFGIGITPASNLDVATPANTTAAVRTTAATGQTATLLIEGANTAAFTDISVLQFGDNSGVYNPLAKITVQKQTVSTQQGNILLETNDGTGSYNKITIDKDSGMTFSVGGTNGKFTPNSNTLSGGIVNMAYEGYFWANKVYNAVWNDIADFFEVPNAIDVEPGRVYVMDEKSARISNSYMEEGIIGIASDTYGYGLGKKNIDNEIPIGVAGIVLAFVDQEYKVGVPLTAGPDGILVEFKQADKVQFPERIVATFFRKEDKEKLVSGEQEVPVNGRYWVKIK